MQQYIREQRKQGKRITVFNIISATFLHTFLRRPQLNRFVAGRRLYQHNSFDILYVVKTALTDEGLESIAKVNFDGDDTLEDVKDKMDYHIDEIKDSEGKEDDRFIGLITKLPRSILRVLLLIGRVLDFHGLMPKVLRDLIPLYSPYSSRISEALGATLFPSLVRIRFHIHLLYDRENILQTVSRHLYRRGRLEKDDRLEPHDRRANLRRILHDQELAVI